MLFYAKAYRENDAEIVLFMISRKSKNGGVIVGYPWISHGSAHWGAQDTGFYSLRSNRIF